MIAARRFGRGWLFPPLRPAANTAPAELFGFFPEGEPLALSLPGDAAPLALRHVPASARMLLSLPLVLGGMGLMAFALRRSGP